MATLDLIWQLHMDHAYCAETPDLPRWRFEMPAAPTGALLRPLRDGVALYAEPDQALPAHLWLAVSVGDGLFDNYTTGLDAPPGQVPLWSPLGEVPGSSEVSLKPAGYVALQRAGQRLALAMPGRGAAPHYRMAIAARSTIWKYLLLGDPRRWGAQQLRVTDPEGGVEFTEGRPEPLADGSPATVIVSRHPLPLEHGARRRFELHGTPRHGPERVLIEHLPVAHARGFGQRDASGALVSEIFVRP
jgi:hypothetical protein